MKLRISLALAFVSILSLAAVPASAGTSFTPVYAVAAPGGAVALPDPNSSYVSPADIHAYIRAGGKLTAEMKLKHHLFRNIISTPGGILRGTVETFDSSLGTAIIGLPGGPLEGIALNFEVPASAEVHAAPQGEGEVRTFETTMYSLTGRLQDPNNVFESFELVAGDAHGLPSPGVTTLIQQEDGSFLIDSRFDVSFRVHFVGSPDGPLAGFEDEVEGQVTVVATSVQK